MGLRRWHTGQIDSQVRFVCFHTVLIIVTDRLQVAPDLRGTVPHDKQRGSRKGSQVVVLQLWSQHGHELAAI